MRERVRSFVGALFEFKLLLNADCEFCKTVNRAVLRNVSISSTPKLPAT